MELQTAKNRKIAYLTNKLEYLRNKVEYRRETGGDTSYHESKLQYTLDRLSELGVSVEV
jgi:hypothetical protein